MATTTILSSNEKLFLRAAKVGDLELLKNLIKKVDINSKDDKDCTTALHFAANGFCYKDSEAIKYLIENGSIIDSKNKFGDTPLHLASSYGGLEGVKCLVENGAQVDAQNEYGRTPLQSAVISKRGKLEVVKFLIENGGAEIDVSDHRDKTALCYAKEYKKPEMVKYLMEKMNELNLNYKRKGSKRTLLHRLL